MAPGYSRSAAYLASVRVDMAGTALTDWSEVWDADAGIAEPAHSLRSAAFDALASSLAPIAREYSVA